MNHELFSSNLEVLFLEVISNLKILDEDCKELIHFTIKANSYLKNLEIENLLKKRHPLSNIKFKTDEKLIESNLKLLLQSILDMGNTIQKICNKLSNDILVERKAKKALDRLLGSYTLTFNEELKEATRCKTECSEYERQYLGLN